MQRTQILEFLEALDAALVPYAREGERLDLYLIGRCALVFRCGVPLATSDVDMVARMGPEHLENKALELFGKGTANANEWGIHLEAVPQGLPPIPQSYCKKSTDIAGNWRVLRPKQPEAHDLAVTKLKRFHAKDRQDLQLLCDRGQVTPEGLNAALDSAYAFSPDDEEDPGRAAAYRNLRLVVAYLKGERRAL